jgi:hypothetical protein
MTHARAKIWARLIRKGHKTIEDVAEADRDDVRAAYLEIFGEELA